MRTTSTALLLSIVAGLQAQNLATFIDYRKHMYVFDSGVFSELEPLPPQAVALCGNYFVYQSANGDLRMYQGGKVKTIESNIATLPLATDHLFGFKMAGALKVYDGQELKTLCRTTGGFVVEDSLVAWYDDQARMFSVSYAGSAQEVEDGLVNDPVSDWRSGDNILAWVTQPAGKFKVFYRGEVHELAIMAKELNYKAGLDVVAYQDPDSKTFKAFYRGEVHDLEEIMPTTYQAGKGIVAYQSVAGTLKVFSGGHVYTAAEFAPDEYFIKDSLVVFKDKGYMKVFCNGNVYTVAQYWPSVWAASWSSLAYLDVNQNVQVWAKGTSTMALQREPITDLTMDRGLLIIRLKLGAVRVWWRGTVYKG